MRKTTVALFILGLLFSSTAEGQVRSAHRGSNNPKPFNAIETVQTTLGPVHYADGEHYRIGENWVFTVPSFKKNPDYLPVIDISLSWDNTRVYARATLYCGPGYDGKNIDTRGRAMSDSNSLHIRSISDGKRCEVWVVFLNIPYLRGNRTPQKVTYQLTVASSTGLVTEGEVYLDRNGKPVNPIYTREDLIAR